MSTIAIVDYGTGNLRSVSQAVHAVAGKADVVVTGEPARIAAADRVIFPGQGAMGDCMRHLEESGLRPAVEAALRNKPVLAICIGLQMLFDKSDEDDCPGLGLYRGKVLRFPEAALVTADGRKLKVPQMGWNTIICRQQHPQLRATLCVRRGARQRLCHAVSSGKECGRRTAALFEFRELGSGLKEAFIVLPPTSARRED